MGKPFAILRISCVSAYSNALFEVIIKHISGAVIVAHMTPPDIVSVYSMCDKVIVADKSLLETFKAVLKDNPKIK